MYVAVGQFAVTPEWEVNARKCLSLMAEARQKGASLLVLPEALLARADANLYRAKSAGRDRVDQGVETLQLQ